MSCKCCGKDKTEAPAPAVGRAQRPQQTRRRTATDLPSGFAPAPPELDAWQRPVGIAPLCLGVPTAQGPVLLGERDDPADAGPGRGVLSYIEGAYLSTGAWLQSSAPVFPTMTVTLSPTQLAVWPFPSESGGTIGASFSDWTAPPFNSHWRYRISGTATQDAAGTLTTPELRAPISSPGAWAASGTISEPSTVPGRALLLEAQGFFASPDPEGAPGPRSWMAPLQLALEHYVPSDAAARADLEARVADGQTAYLPNRLVLLSPTTVTLEDADGSKRPGRERIYPKPRQRLGWYDAGETLWTATFNGETWTNQDYGVNLGLETQDPNGVRGLGFLGAGYAEGQGPEQVEYTAGMDPDYPQDYYCANQGDALLGVPVQYTPLTELITTIRGVPPVRKLRDTLAVEALLPGLGRFEVHAPDNSVTSGGHRDQLVGGASMTLGGASLTGSSWAIMRRRGGELNLLTLGAGTLTVHRPGASYTLPVGGTWLEHDLTQGQHPDHVRLIGERAYILTGFDAFRDLEPGERPRRLDGLEEADRLEGAEPHGISIVAEVPLPTFTTAGLPRYGREPRVLFHSEPEVVWPWSTPSLQDAEDERGLGTELIQPAPVLFPTSGPVVIVGRARGGEPEDSDNWTWSSEYDGSHSWRPFTQLWADGAPGTYEIDAEVEHLTAYGPYADVVEG